MPLYFPIYHIMLQLNGQARPVLHGVPMSKENDDIFYPSPTPILFFTPGLIMDF